MKIALPAVLLVMFFISGRPTFAQDQNPQVAPTSQETLDFLNSHRHTYYSECVNTEYSDPHGYITAASDTVRALGIDSVTAANGTLTFRYITAGYDDDATEKIQPQDHNITFVLRSIKIASLVVEENPAEASCRDDHAMGASNCGGRPCPAVPYRFSINTPYWVRLNDGVANTYKFGLPVMTREEGDRVVKAILHMIELAGGQTKEVF
ncbi:hypothetical protein [Granulicella sp. L46]|uniref:hypothetical protein n=1 Tax=Granulicella sp. L46 TaxID=1641865 RepID=UPI00131AD56A|nr:hypothetical protein [Granulicella sp. L46]